MALPAMPPRDGRCGLAQSRQLALMAPGAMADDDWRNSRSTSTLPSAMANVGWLKFIMVLRAMPPSDGRCGLAQT